MSTLDGLESQVYAVLRDERREFVTEPMVITWLNEAQRDLASRLHELITDQKTGVVGEDAATYYASDGTTDLGADAIVVPSDLITVKTLLVGDSEFTVFTDDEVFNSYVQVEGTPIRGIGRIFGMQTYDAGLDFMGYEHFIELVGPASGDAYVMRYTRYPLELEDPNDVVEVPQYLETRIVNYARSHAKAQQGEDAQRDYYMALYERNLPAPPNGQILTRPGPITMSYEGNAFDYQADASHRG